MKIALHLILSWMGILSIWLHTAGIAQAPDMVFQRFGAEDGLSMNAVNCLMQDRQGFLWIGTQNGLNRYDGYTFRQFFHDAQDSSSLSNNWIKALLQDRHGFIWVGTQGGLSVFDPTMERWYRFVSDKKNRKTLTHFDIFSLYEDQEGVLWVGTGRGFNKIIREGKDPGQWYAHRYPAYAGLSPERIPHSVIEGIAEDQHQRLWFTSHSSRQKDRTYNNGTVSVWDKQRQHFVHYQSNPDDSTGLADDEMSVILIDSKDRIWVGTIYEGLHRFLPEQNRFLPYPIGAPQGISHRLIRTISEDRQGNLWIGTYQGLACLPKAEGKEFVNYGADPASTTETYLGSVSNVLEDRSGNLWIGSELGLFKATNTSQGFLNYLPQSGDSIGLVGADVFGILEHSNGDIWVASYQSGLTQLIPQPDGTEQIHHHRVSPNLSNQLPTNTVISIDEGKDGHIWLGSFEGLIEVLPGKGPEAEALFRSYRHDPQIPGRPSSDYIYQALPDQKGNIWMATYTLGVEYMYPSNGEMHIRRYGMDVMNPYSIPSSRPTKLFQDPEGNVWVATHGLSRLYLNEQGEAKFRHLFIDPMDIRLENHIGARAIHWDDSGTMWLASNRGLWKINWKEEDLLSPWEHEVSYLLEPEMINYGEKEGFPTTEMVGLLVDDHGRFWISSQRGLSRFDPQSLEIRNYDSKDGLFGNEMNGFAFEKTKKGDLLFGGLGGMVRFHPDSLKTNQNPPSVCLTEIRLFNEKLEVGASIPQSAFVLQASPQSVQEIRLSHKDYVISFEYAALDFTKPVKNQYAYQMIGLDESWIEAGSRRFVTYTNLSPGEYIFRVKASNNDGIWNEEGMSLRIIVDPPWWQTGWAYLLYLLLLGIIVFAIVRYRTEKVRHEMRTLARVEQAKVEERDQVRAQSSRDFHDEAGNHITKISLYTGLIKRGAEQHTELEEYADQIERNLTALSGGMRDFIWVLDPQKDGLDQIIQRLIDFGYDMFKHSEIEFVAKNQIPEKWYIHLEVSAKRNLLLIFKEAMNNTLKYAQASTVQFIATLEQDHFCLELIDDGLGFDQDKLVRVNGLNNMKTRAEKMQAEFKVEAVPGLGTRILVRKEIHPNG
ncbi:MAG: two-component regulator propeller domain-containing protein [Bacteroidota bacterium]